MDCGASSSRIYRKVNMLQRMRCQLIEGLPSPALAHEKSQLSIWWEFLQPNNRLMQCCLPTTGFLLKRHGLTIWNPHWHLARSLILPLSRSVFNLQSTFRRPLESCGATVPGGAATATNPACRKEVAQNSRLQRTNCEPGNPKPSTSQQISSILRKVTPEVCMQKALGQSS